MRDINGLSIDELTNDEYEKVMNAASIQGFKLFIFGMLTFGIYPIIWHIMTDKK